MNSIEQPPPAPLSEPLAEPPLSETKISGFDCSSPSILKEPSFFLSVVLIFIAMAACFSKAPSLFFWLTTICLIVFAIALHMLAERFLFKSNKELSILSSPLEGLFVVTFGSVLPGLGLLAYGVYAIFNSTHSNVLEETGKLLLLLIVPLFNFSVWSAVRRRYLIRPRLTGVMNGFALGLSASWTAIWLKSAFIAHGADTKFGWMLLLCVSPLLLFSAACLSLDLQRRTEPKISRIATTFSVLGCLLSVMFAFAPMCRTLYVQSLLTKARNATMADKPGLIANLRAQALPEDLRPSKYPVSGFSLSSLLLGDRGLDDGGDSDRDLYFKITGKSFADSNHEEAGNSNNGGNSSSDESSSSDGSSSVDAPDAEQSLASSVVGSKVLGLALSKSQMVGNVDAATLTGAIDWSMTMHNSSSSEQEARGVVSLPPNSVVSRVTLWIDGKPREAAFASPTKTEAAYNAVLQRSHDPFLVTLLAPNKVLLQCYPVAATGGEMKVRIGLKLGLKTSDGKLCSMEFPRLLASNFAVPKRNQIRLTSNAPFGQGIAGGVISRTGNNYVLTGIVKDRNSRSKSKNSVSIVRERNFSSIATLDATAQPSQYIVERLTEITRKVPKRLVVVMDTSSSMRKHLSEIQRDLAEVSTFFKPLVYVIGEKTDDKGETIVVPAVSFAQAQKMISADAFDGGKDNRPALTEALELVSEEPDGAVLWIHGAQPLTQYSSDSSTLDLLHPVRLYDMQIEPGSNQVLQSLSVADPSGFINRESVNKKSSITDAKALVTSWKNPEKQLVMQREISKVKPNLEIVDDPVAAIQVARLWANEQVKRLIAGGFEHQALTMAEKYRLVSPITGAVVLDDIREYLRYQLNPGFFKGAVAAAPLPLMFNPRQPADSYSALVGAPVDPRYGQSNEVGQMADFGYDTMRDISRWITAISLFVALLFGVSAFRSRKAHSLGEIVQTSCKVCAIPLVVHLLGTYLINNFGGLGGGL